MSLNISGLAKTYPNGVRAIDGINLGIGTGMFGLLGPNGAGKSTLMRTIATLQSPDSGSISFDGIDVLKEPMRLRRVLGYLPQEFGVYPGVSAESLLDYFAALKGVSSRAGRRRLVGYVLEATNLYEVRKKHVDSFSGGMRQRFGIAQLLLGNPRLIIVDEPTAGLDPAERRRFLNILREVGTHNTVVFSTHIVDDVKELCHEMAILNNGRILQKAAPAAATAALKGLVWTRAVPRETLEHMEARYDVLSSSYNPDHSVNIRVYAPERPSPEFTAAEPQLEDVYFIALKNKGGYEGQF
ncbi:MAG: ABC transporter ATP-binding protein [Phaeodactylibacter sp.]|nr:ABC transporter ATP-binding protein [Phaeodactylibacter sp.]